MILWRPLDEIVSVDRQKNYSCHIRTSADTIPLYTQIKTVNIYRLSVLNNVTASITHIIQNNCTKF